MSASGSIVRCRGCGALVPTEGIPPEHAYIDASPGCWSLFAELRGREASDPGYLAHGCSITDAYMIQHPGVPGRQSSQSVWVHLVGLQLVVERGMRPLDAIDVVRRILVGHPVFPWLDPPPSLGATTVADVAAAGGPDEYADAVRRWARDAWQAWAIHHERIRDLATAALAGTAQADPH